jgi:hypothetical protein
MALLIPMVQDDGVAGPWSWAVAWSAAPGEVRCGDRHVILNGDAGTVLAVVDALGHGAEAAAVADRAAEALTGAAAGMDAERLTRACHAALEGTRGAVMTLAVHTAETQSLVLLGVGNVEGVMRSGDATEHVFNTPGIVGYRLPALHPRQLPARPGDLLILATDGIDMNFSATVTSSPQSITTTARRVLESHRRTQDDALVLVARLDGGAG